MSKRFRITPNIVEITNLDYPGNGPITFSEKNWQWTLQFAKAARAASSAEAVQFVMESLDLPWIEARTLLFAAAEHVGGDSDTTRHAPAPGDLYFNKKTGLIHELRQIGGVSNFLYFGPGTRWVDDCRTSVFEGMQPLHRQSVNEHLVYVDPNLFNNYFLEVNPYQKAFWVKPVFQSKEYSVNPYWTV